MADSNIWETINILADMYFCVVVNILKELLILKTLIRWAHWVNKSLSRVPNRNILEMRICHMFSQSYYMFILIVSFSKRSSICMIYSEILHWIQRLLIICYFTKVIFMCNHNLSMIYTEATHKLCINILVITPKRTI